MIVNRNVGVHGIAIFFNMSIVFVYEFGRGIGAENNPVARYTTHFEPHQSAHICFNSSSVSEKRKQRSFLVIFSGIWKYDVTWIMQEK